MSVKVNYTVHGHFINYPKKIEDKKEEQILQLKSLEYFRDKFPQAEPHLKNINFSERNVFLISLFAKDSGTPIGVTSIELSAQKSLIIFLREFPSPFGGYIHDCDDDISSVLVSIEKVPYKNYLIDGKYQDYPVGLLKGPSKKENVFTLGAKRDEKIKEVLKPAYTQESNLAYKCIKPVISSPFNWSNFHNKLLRLEELYSPKEKPFTENPYKEYLKSYFSTSRWYTDLTEQGKKLFDEVIELEAEIHNINEEKKPISRERDLLIESAKQKFCGPWLNRSSFYTN